MILEIEELLNNKKKYDNFIKNIKKKISNDYNTPINKIIVAFPQRGSLEVHVIFQSDEFNDLNLEDFVQNLKRKRIIYN